MAIPRMSDVPYDGNGVPLPNYWKQVGTKVLSNVGTSGVEISFTTDIKGLMIIPSVAATFAGTVTDYSDDAPISSPLLLDVATSANIPIGTVKAVSGTINVTLIFGR